MISFLLVLSLSSIATVPNQGDPSDVEWIITLNKALHVCFDQFDPAIKQATVKIGEPPLIARSVCDASRTCEIRIGRDALSELSDQELLFLVGHEAAHISLEHPEYQGLEYNYKQLLADMLAAQALPSGACHGARTIQWVSGKLDGRPGTEEARDLLERRRYAMLGLCAANALQPQVETSP